MSASIDPAQNRLPIERRVRVRQSDGALSAPEPISHFSAVRAWVLIGNPGAGKTDAFKERSAAEGGDYITARNFVDLEQSPTVSLLFVDGLDEIAAGNALGFTALGQMRTKLQRMGTPKFRISCREADWRGSTDSEALRHLVGEKDFLELHLEPLNSQEVEELIAHWQPSSAQKAADFIKEAEKHNLDGLLDNPQTLRMLVEATASGWPANKTQTYQMACAKLMREHNDQWLAVTREDAHPDDELLQAAGYLCSLMLLSGGASLALQRPGNKQKDVLSLPQLRSNESAPDIGLCRAALHTRLFRGNGSGEFFPVHRTVAEYLAAQYIAKRINAGLPSKRVLALMLGEDAGVVPELRGLHAWLAATATGNLRMEFIDRDPLGVILNGDVQSFTRSEKLRVLDALSNEAKRYIYFRSQNWVSQPFGALATADMEGDFRSLLRSSDRSPAHMALIDCVLDAIAHGQRMPGLNAELEKVVRDTSYWPGSRTEALRILIAFDRRDDKWSISRTLLEDIHAGIVEDSEDELLGTLLLAMYPGQLSPAEIWSHFRKPKSNALLGSYWRFWHDLPGKSAPDDDIPILLDAIIARSYQLSNQHDHLRSARIVGELLVKGVRQVGSMLTISHLYQWLSLGLGPHYHSPLEQEHKEALGEWLKNHPAKYKALFEFGLYLELETKKSGMSLIWPVRRHLYDAPMPHDADNWYLSLAKKSPHKELRRELVAEAFHLTEVKRGADDALQLIEVWRVTHPDDATWVDEFLQRPYPRQGLDQESIDLEIEYKNRTREEEQQKLAFFQRTLPGFLEGPADLGALIEISNAYLNFFHHSNETTPDTRLLELLNQNQEWRELALHGLRQCLFRKDLPTASDIVELNAQGRRYNLATPCMAAMALRWAENSATALELPDPVIETMVAFRLTNDYDTTPEWFKRLTTTRPDILALVMGPLINAQVTAKKEHVDGLYALAHDADYAEIAKLITPALLKNFPSKAHNKQLKSLRLLIVSLMTSLDKPVQLEIIADKLGGKPSDVAQHVYWFTAGLQAAPDLYLNTARQYIAHTQTRISHLIELVHEQREREGSRIALPVAALEFLIEILGPRCTPRWPNQSGWVSPAMELGRYVEGLISTLAGNHDDDAMQALAALLQHKTLKQWEDSLRRAMFDQRLTRRKASFQPASVTKVSSTLANLTPANAADLWALTLDHLQQLAHEIRNGNTNGYRQYWAGGKSKLEDECRDNLLFALRPRLSPLSVSAEPEGRYADEKCADIKVSSQGYHIPIEIKREMHRGLWSAISNQLIARYTRELASDGYGIFLVFWFGGTGQPVAGDGGTKPKTASELQERLQRTVPAGYENKITVLVVDCSLRPAGKVR
ncbi:MAG: hypothetical protein Q8O29_14500 [Polaromonas sp.]|uniref:NACHT domain-containing protein n=1 Tax=Polaromonas sp. TaxID=1869339 RepID=UPI002737687D|nr:hypothetical protein [Polaromonas sp.]MDP2819445.1 hypothetical protein [Polaromonas sp.]